MDNKIIKQLLTAQYNEITEYHIYNNLARRLKNKQNADILQRIADDEKRHYDFWKTYTKQDVKPSKFKVFYFSFLSRVFGLTFAIKLMEKGEEAAQVDYNELSKEISGAKQIANDEEQHEEELIELIEEEKLNYIGSIVLGLNDALVELTGTLAGLTFALQNTKIIGAAGLITGIAASFSMAASEYLSHKSEGKNEDALKASVYTGIAYVFTVFVLIIPYFLLSNFYACLGITLLVAIFIIFFFNYYLSVVKNLSFKERFLEMVFLSLGVAALTFGIGFIIRKYLGFEI